MSFIATINGHPWDLTKSPAQDQSNAFLLWTLQQALAKVNIVKPYVSMTIEVVTSPPPTYQTSVTFEDGASIQLTYTFDDLFNPLFAFEINGHWRLRHIAAARGVVDAVTEVLMLNPSLITSVFMIRT